jgi:hypothetical protein
MFVEAKQSEIDLPTLGDQLLARNLQLPARVGGLPEFEKLHLK